MRWRGRVWGQSVGLVIVLIAFGISGCDMLDVGEGAQVLTEAQFLPGSEAEIEPPRADAPWVPATLPGRWRATHPDLTRCWYRLELRLPESPDKPWGVYIPRVSMTANVYVNGEMVGSGGRMERPIARNWNRPLYFDVAPSAWRAGTNVILVHIATYPGYGYLGPVVAGPHEDVLPVYETQHWVLNTLAMAVAIFAFFTGAFVLFVWFGRRRDTEYLWFVLAVLGLSVFALNQFVRDIPFSAKIWWWLVHAGILLWGFSLCRHILKTQAMSRPWFVRFWAVYCTIAVTVYAAVGYYDFYTVTMIGGGGAIFMLAWMSATMLRDWARRRDRDSLFYGAMLIVLIGIAVHDLVMQSGAVVSMWYFDHHLLHYGIPAVTVVVGGRLIMRFVNGLNEAETLNRDLERRVETARDEISRSYAVIEEITREQAMLQERERIYQDLHDDVGAKLLTLSQRLDGSSEAELPRSALQDLRDIVSSRNRGGSYVDEMITEWRLEAEERLSGTSVALHWDEPSSLSEMRVSEFSRSHLTRLVREAVTNVLKHARATYIRIKVRYDAGLHVSVCNDGCPQDPDQWGRGSGLANIAKRARDLGGDCGWRMVGEDEVCLRFEVGAEGLGR